MKTATKRIDRDELEATVQQMENRSINRNYTFLMNDSSRSTSLIEIVPAGPVKYDPGSGWSFQASKMKVYTETKTGKRIDSRAKAEEKEKLGTQYQVGRSKITEASATQTNKEQKPSLNWIVVFAFVLVAALLFRFFFRRLF